MPATKVTGRASTIPDLGTTLPPQSVMERYFGPINDASRETWVPFAGLRVQVNKILAANVRAAGRAITAAGLAREVNDVGGFRTSVGASGAPIPYSMHQYGAAIDINEGSENWHTMTLDPRLVAIMSDYGWFCGENWSGASRDGGHFQFTGKHGVSAQAVPGGHPGGMLAAALAGLAAVGVMAAIVIGAAAVAGLAAAWVMVSAARKVTEG